MSHPAALKRDCDLRKKKTRFICIVVRKGICKELKRISSTSFSMLSLICEAVILTIKGKQKAVVKAPFNSFA